MARTPRRKHGEVIGGFALAEPLGVGGNGEVWRAESADGTVVALKVVFAKNAASEPYRRFRREVELHQRVGVRPGVVPTLEFSLPDAPTKRAPAWLTMPVADPLVDSLGEEPSLEDVVSAVHGIAATLAELLEEFGIAHRDIKPDNLYFYEGLPAVGDFGLVQLPETESITGTAENLGPAFFIAPEMLFAPGTADGGPADVYSLAKTLHVLATSQRYPPPGQQRVGAADTIASYFPEPRAAVLALLVERCTAYDPAERPSMREVARELGAWRSGPAPTQPVGDLTEIARRLEAVSIVDRRRIERRADGARLGNDLGKVIIDHLTSVYDQLLANQISWVSPPASDSTFVANVEPLGTDEPWSSGWTIVVHGQSMPVEVVARIGFAVRTDERERVRLLAGYLVGHASGAGGPSSRPPLAQQRVFDTWLGSEEAQSTVAELTDFLRESLPAALEDLMQQVETARGGGTPKQPRPPLSMEKFHELRELTRPAPETADADPEAVEKISAMVRRLRRLQAGLPVGRSARQSLANVLRMQSERGELLRSTLEFAAPRAPGAPVPALEDDVQAWEAHVTAALKEYPLLQAQFKMPLPSLTAEHWPWHGPADSSLGLTMPPDWRRGGGWSPRTRPG